MAGVEQDSDDFRIVCPPVNKEDGRLPRKYTDEAQGVHRGMSPPIEWYNVPEGTKSLALVVEDIDAPDPESPVVPWTIWVVAHIPPTLKGLPEGFSGKDHEVGNEYGDITEGHNDEKVPGWRVPTMPSHGHRIEFKLYALDEEVNVGKKVTKEKLLDTIGEHVIGEASMIAVF